MKNCIMALLALLLTGCHSYVGHCTFDEERDIHRENEKVISEKYQATVNGTRIEMVRHAERSFDQVSQIDTFESDCWWGGDYSLGEIILIPFRIIFSPLALLAPGQRIDTINGRTYVRTRARIINNGFNPFVMILHDESDPIIETAKIATESRRLPKSEEVTEKIPSGEVTVTVGEKNYQLKLEDDHRDFFKQLFTVPFPPKTLDAAVGYQDQQNKVTLSSLNMASESDSQEWQIVCRAQNEKKLSFQDYLAGLNALKSLGDKKMLTETDRKALFASITAGLNAKKFPVSGPGVKLYKDIYAGTSAEYLQFIVSRSDSYRKNVRFFTQPAPGGKNVVVSCEIVIPNPDIKMNSVIAKYQQEFSDVKCTVVDKREQEKREFIARNKKVPAQMLNEIAEEYFPKDVDFLEATLDNDTVKIVIQNAIHREKRLYDGAVRTTSTGIRISIVDKRHSEMCEKERVRRERTAKEQIERERREKAKKDLDF